MKSRSFRRALIATAVFVTLAAAFVSILPEVARRLAINRLERALRVPVRIDDVDINLFTGRAALENLVIGTPEPRPILTLPRISVEFSRRAALTGDIDLYSIFVQEPSLVIERLDAKTYNVAQAIRFDPKQGKDETQAVRFAIRDLQIQRGEIVFIDHTRQADYRVTFRSLDLTAGPISSLPGEVTPTEFTAGVQIAGGLLRVKGSSKLFGSILETELQAEIANVRLNEFGAYLPFGGRLELADSAVDGRARYVLSSKQGKVTQHELEATLELGAVALMAQAPESQALARFEQVSARDIKLDLLHNQVQIGALAVDHPFLFLRRDAAGLNLHQLTPSGIGLPTGQEPSTMPVMIQKIEANGGTIEFTDATLSPPLKTVLEGVAANGNDLVLSAGFKTGDLSAEAQLGSGSIKLEGNMDAEPLRGEFSLVGRNLPFAPFDGYLDRLFTNAKFTGDTLSGALQITLSTEERGGGATSLLGKVEGRNVGLHFPDAENSFLTSNRVAVVLGTLRLGSDPRVDIERIALEGARLEVVRNEAGELNLTRLWAAPKAKDSSTKTEPGGEAETSVEIRSITVEEGEVKILDRSVSPNYTTTVSQLNGSLAELSPNTKRSELKMEGRLGEDAHLMLTGWFTPFAEKPAVRLNGTIKSYALPPLNPYATEYLSHRIRQGQVTTEIDYTLTGNELQANAGLVLRNLRLGEKTGDQFAQRIGIPLELAIALLQDASGIIRLQVAMTSETGPRLNVASLIWRAVRNALVRAITAPFRLVGNIFTLGGRIGGISIDPVLFVPGTREPQPESKKQFDQLATLLNEKPRLELALNGNVSRSELDALKTKRFWQRIQSAKGRNYEEALINIYRQLGGISDPALPLAPIAEESLEKFVLERLDLDVEEQKKLALERAQLVEEELRSRGVDPERLTVSAAESPASAESPSFEFGVSSS
jgi:uncharacterized protein involved in outer membrane biogenesis